MKRTKPARTESADERVHVGEMPPIKTKRDRRGKRNPPGGHYGKTDSSEVWEAAQKRESK